MFYRQIRQARRNGPLRYIIPHPDDLPPPYSHYGPASMTLNQNENADGHQGNCTIPTILFTNLKKYVNI